MTLLLARELRSIQVSHLLTAAQSGAIDIRPFRKAEEALFHKFGLKPRVIPDDNQAVGVGGKAKVFGKVEMPSGMGGVNGKVKYTVVDSPGVPPLTPEQTELFQVRTDVFRPVTLPVSSN